MWFIKDKLQMQNNPIKAGSGPSQRQFVLFLCCDRTSLSSKLSPQGASPMGQEMPSLVPREAGLPQHWKEH